jgi:hypothetical protein
LLGTAASLSFVNGCFGIDHGITVLLALLGESRLLGTTAKFDIIDIG